MFKWTQDLAVVEIRALIAQIGSLRRETRFSASHTRWVAQTFGFLEQVFGQKSRYYLNYEALSWHAEGSFIVGGPEDPEGSFAPQVAMERLHHQAYLRQLETAKGLLLAALDDLTRYGMVGVYKGKDTGPETSALVTILALVERKLRKAIREKPDKEKQVQDAFETLLLGAAVAFEREIGSIVYSSKTYTPDFSFPTLDLALELKLCNRGDREKQMIPEINDDIPAYKTKYGNIIFGVYDLGFIRDVERFGDAFEDNDGVIVRVVKH